MKILEWKKEKQTLCSYNLLTDICFTHPRIQAGKHAYSHTKSSQKYVFHEIREKKCDFDLLVYTTHTIPSEYMWHVDDTMCLFIYAVVCVRARERTRVRLCEWDSVQMRMRGANEWLGVREMEKQIDR